MPNWVSNSLTISVATEERRDEIMAILGAPVVRATSNEDSWEVETEASQPLSYWNIDAPPVEKYEEYFGLSGWKDGVRYGDGSYNWYNWNNNNWGCKWDATEVDVETFDLFDGRWCVTYHFESPWSPPSEFYEKLAKTFQDAELQIEWEEEQGFGAYLESDGQGGVVELRQWDIPSTHAEFAEKDREDSCLCAYGDGEHFDDCPEENWKEKGEDNE